MSKPVLDTACPFTKEERASRAMRRAMLVEVPQNPCRGNIAGELEFCSAVCGLRSFGDGYVPEIWSAALAKKIYSKTIFYSLLSAVWDHNAR